MKHKICGTLKAPALKILPLQNASVKQENGLVYIEGYANTKNLADRYGDIPTVLKTKRNFVYELSEFKKNPVLLIDHVNQLDHLAGSVTEIFEDEKGLYFKALFSASNHPTIAHARQLYKEGHAKGISIAGRFHYEVPSNPSLLTLAEIYEISLVAIPADPRSLATPAKTTDDEEEQRRKQEKSNRQKLEKEINAWLKELRK
ncbi:MAG: HK97 family phage prohead protease [Elusimicrobiaceae bacterium]|nr:HK97 family phage prohead protease [Elusimicrobiaceae bacterium]